MKEVLQRHLDERLKEDAQKLAIKIKRFVDNSNQNNLILIRHDSDADGYVGGYVLERSIKAYVKYKQKYVNVMRMPSRSPNYTYSDLLRDLVLFKQYNQVMLIFVDMGSSYESYISYKKLPSKVKYYVIDHHPFYEEIRYSLNPLKYNLSGEITAGLIAIYVSLEIRALEIDYDLLAAISLVGDKVFHTTFSKEIFLRVDVSFDELVKLTRFVDFEAWNLTGQDYGIITYILNPLMRQKALSFYEEYLEPKEKYALELALLHTIKQKNVHVVEIDAFYLPGSWPPPSKITTLVFEFLKESSHDVVVIGKTQHSIIYRSTFDNLDFNNVLDHLKSKSSWMIEGGGHKVAGSLKAPSQKIHETLNLLIDVINDELSK